MDLRFPAAVYYRSNCVFSDTGIGLQESPYSKQDYVKTDYIKPDYSSPPEHHHLQQQLHPDMTSMAYPPVGSHKPSAYSVNGISLSSPNVDMMHPAMGYQSKTVFITKTTFITLILTSIKSRIIGYLELIVVVAIENWSCCCYRRWRIVDMSSKPCFRLLY